MIGGGGNTTQLGLNAFLWYKDIYISGNIQPRWKKQKRHCNQNEANRPIRGQTEKIRKGESLWKIFISLLIDDLLRERKISKHVNWFVIYFIIISIHQNQHREFSCHFMVNDGSIQKYFLFVLLFYLFLPWNNLINVGKSYVAFITHQGL